MVLLPGWNKKNRWPNCLKFALPYNSWVFNRTQDAFRAHEQQPGNVVVVARFIVKVNTIHFWKAYSHRHFRDILSTRAFKYQQVMHIVSIQTSKNLNWSITVATTSHSTNLAVTTITSYTSTGITRISKTQRGKLVCFALSNCASITAMAVSRTVPDLSSSNLFPLFMCLTGDASYPPHF